MTGPFSEIVTPRLRLVPFDGETARAVVEGNLTHVRAAPGGRKKVPPTVSRWPWNVTSHSPG